MGIIILAAMPIDKFASRWWLKTGVSMGDPRAVGAQIRMRLPSLTPPKGMLAAEIARRNGARTVAVTNSSQSPLAKRVDVVLCSTNQRDRQAADANLNRTMRAVQSKRRL